MAGRPAKPIDLHIVEGKKHLTKSEIEARKAQENSLKSQTNFRPNEHVKNNKAALKMFRKLKRLYKDISYVDGLDENIINRYCLMIAEADGLENLLVKIQDDVEACEKPSDRVQLYKTIANAEATLHRMRDMLMKMEDRMFLNPTSRIKNVPKKQEEPQQASKWDKYKAGAAVGSSY